MDNTDKVAAYFKDKLKDHKPSPFLASILTGDSTTIIASETARALEKDMEERGATEFTMADIRRVQLKMFGV